MSDLSCMIYFAGVECTLQGLHLQEHPFLRIWIIMALNLNSLLNRDLDKLIVATAVNTLLVLTNNYLNL